MQVEKLDVYRFHVISLAANEQRRCVAFPHPPAAFIVHIYIYIERERESGVSVYA